MIDVIIVGAGPAGSSAATILAKKGWNVLVIEKEQMPRHKHCAGVISNKTCNVLEEQGIDCSNVLEQEYAGSMISFRDLEVQIFTGERICSAAYREKFDHLLTVKAVENGAELVNDVVTGICMKKDFVEVYTKTGDTIKSRLVLGADGVNSNVRKSIGIPLEREKLALTLEAEIKVPWKKIDQLYGACQHIDLGYIDSGYVWAFPKIRSETINVGLGYPLKDHGKLPEKPVNILRRFIKDRKITEKPDIKFHSAIMPFLGTCPTLGKERVLLLGDAAGFVDPIIGDGILYAIESGLLAGKVSNIFLTEDVDLMSEYKESVNHIIEEINIYGLEMYKLMHGDSNRRLNMVKLCATDKRIATTIIKMFSKEINYNQALKEFSTSKIILPLIKSFYLSKIGGIKRNTKLEIST